MTTHQQKKLERADLIAFRDRFALPLTDDEAPTLAFYKPADDSAEMRYLRERRARARRLDAAPRRERRDGRGARRSTATRRSPSTPPARR